MLGILVAVFVVVLLGPSVWRRAFVLARRQVHAELPVTLAEIRADRDGLRAEHAVVASRLSQQLRQEREKTSAQLIRIGEQYDELKRYSALETELATLRETLVAGNKLIEEISAERDSAAHKTEIVEAEAKRLEKNLSSLQELADMLRIEITTKEAEYSRLVNEMTEMRRDRKDASAHYNEVATQLTAVQTELKTQKRRNMELQQKLDKLIADFSDAQERLERYARKGDAGTVVPAEILKENAALREEMAVLAAKMVAATAENEGDASPIHKLLEGESVEKSGKRPKSLASRIRELR
ncbi:hypothetical protein ACFQ3K_13505 [Brucella gallinifaecis]|uniref:hypothetical protein n=1 Tax=Brucella gallinifaecis TaxID=215590 RepID=UPI0018759F09|nr:hypothetical protein [Brucella gallinifaecis]